MLVSAVMQACSRRAGQIITLLIGAAGHRIVDVKEHKYISTLLAPSYDGLV